MSSAYKYAMLQAFCVPVTEVAEADASSLRLKQASHDPQPVEGWEQWAAGIIDIASSCISTEALKRLQDRQRGLLKAISRERPDLYSRIGETFGDRRNALESDLPSQPGAAQSAHAKADQPNRSRPASNSGTPGLPKSPAMSRPRRKSKAEEGASAQ